MSSYLPIVQEMDGAPENDFVTQNNNDTMQVQDIASSANDIVSKTHMMNTKNHAWNWIAVQQNPLHLHLSQLR